MSWFSASPPSQRWAFALTALVTATATAGDAYAQSPAGGALLQGPSKRVKTDDSNMPVTVNAEEITGRPERTVNLTGNVELVRGQTRVTADTACFNQIEDQVDAAGHVRMWRFGDQYKGDQLQLNLDSGKGWVLRPEYRMELNNAQGKATRLDFINVDEAIATDATYSTCEGPNPDWYLKAHTLSLDTARDVGTTSYNVLYFKDVPIPMPALSFSLSGARRSGWLPPSLGGASKGGYELTLPYYFNIAPNRDLTVSPKLILRRGLQMGAIGRYLGETAAGPYLGETRAELLIDDKQTHTDRWLINSTHAQALTRALSFGWSVKAASDDNYPSDFSTSISGSAERQLLRELRTDYRREFWNLSARVQNYQVLQDPAATTDPSLFVPRPYDRLPQLNFHAGRYDVAGFDWSVDAEATRFWHPKLVRGTREQLNTQISYPWVHPGWFITPKLMLSASSYELNNTALGAPDALSRVLPTFSLDSGLVFERAGSLFGRALTQTLEPRLFYVYTPYKDQTQFPNFDSGDAGFSFAQIFSENRFVGSDRIADANQVTAAIVSRFLESSGAERLRLTLGQRFYFREQRVMLDASTPLNQSHSDLLAAASGRIAQDWSFDSAVQYNAGAHKVYSENYGVQWQPRPGHVLNAEYRYLRDSVKNVDLSSQWLLAQRWYGVGRISYSLRDRKVLEGLLGLEYKADCWVFRMGAQRFVTTAQKSSTPYFFQIELNGLSKIGFGNPLDAFSKNVPGYTRLNQGAGR